MKKTYLPKDMHSDKYDKKGREAIAQEVMTAELLKKDKVIQTPFGDALITAGNYVITNELGASVGITPEDFDRRYAEWNK